MLLINLMMWMVFLLTLMIMLISTILSKKTAKDREKSSPFECGFDPKTKKRLPFSIHFFLIALIFVIFDVEVTLILPMIKSMYISNFFSWCFSLVTFLIILLIGLYYEWNYGALDWTN